jgi:hypothetical protein
MRTLAIALCFWIGAYPALALEPAESVSMVRVLANPEKFHGKRIRVIGFLRLEFEGNALYLHEEDYRHLLTDNALWVDMGADKEHAGLSMHYVLIEGTFNAKLRGHLGLCSGVIEKITRAEVWDFKPDKT